MPKLKTDKEGIITLIDEEGELFGIIRKDMKSRKNIFYSCKEMSFDELTDIFQDARRSSNPV
jgi:hypothetical protein